MIVVAHIRRTVFVNYGAHYAKLVRISLLWCNIFLLL